MQEKLLKLLFSNMMTNSVNYFTYVMHGRFWSSQLRCIRDRDLLTLKLPGEGQMALPLNLNEKNIPNADFFLVF